MISLCQLITEINSITKRHHWIDLDIKTLTKATVVFNGKAQLTRDITDGFYTYCQKIL